MTNETIVWSKDNCPYCTKAKNMLKSKGIPFEERNISSDPQWNRETLLEAAPHARTMPQIWMHGEYVGGCDQLEKYFVDHGMWLH